MLPSPPFRSGTTVDLLANEDQNEDRKRRLTNRSAWLSLAASLFFFVGLLTVGTTVQKTEDLAARLASGTPFAVAAGSAIWARTTRAQLRVLGRVDEERGERRGGLASPGGEGRPTSSENAMRESSRP